MAIIGTPIEQNVGRNQTDDATAKTRTEVYQVKTQAGVGDEMNIALSHQLFRIDRPHSTVTGLYLMSKTADLTSDGDTSLWNVTLEWSTGGSSGSIGGSDQSTDPLSFERKFDWGTWSHPEAIVQDAITGLYISNTAGQPYLNPPLQEDLYNPMVTITVNQGQKIESHLRDGVGRVNSGTIAIDGVTIPPFCAKLIEYVSNERTNPNSNSTYVQSRYTYHLNFEKVGPRTALFLGQNAGDPPDLKEVPEGEYKGFRRVILSSGLNRFTAKGLIKIPDGDGGFISDPIALNAKGQPFDKNEALGKEIYLLYNTLEAIDFTEYPRNKIG